MQFDVHGRSIDNAFDKPGVGVTLAEDAIGRTVTDRDVPLIAIPTRPTGLTSLTRLIDPPPARRAPGARTRGDGPAMHSASIDADPDRHATIDTYAGGDGTSESPQRDGWSG